MDAWAWSDHLAPWLAARVELPIGPLFCVDRPRAGGRGQRPPRAVSCPAMRRRPVCGAGLRSINVPT